MSKPLLAIQAVSKEYQEFILGPVAIELHPGETVALMGKNGAGKTTLFQLITGNLDATVGDILLTDQPMLPDQYLLKRQIGYLPQHLQLPRWATGHELLHYAARLHALPDAAASVKMVAERFDCNSYLRRPMAACSHGMQKRVGLAVATIHDPDLLILDEPFSGLDLFHIRALQDSIIDRSRRGKANILSTHIAPYAAQLCQRLWLLDNGQLSESTNWRSLDSARRVTMIENYFFPKDSS